MYSYSFPEYTWKVGWKKTKIKLNFIKQREILLLLEKNTRGGVSSILGDRHVEWNENEQIIYILMLITYMDGQWVNLFQLETSKQ